MSQYNVSGDKGIVAGSDLAAGTIVKKSGATVVAAAAATDVILGTLNSGVKSGQVADVRLRSAQGTLKVKLGGTVAINDAVTSNASGLGITTTTADNQILGYALEAGVSGDIIEVMPSTAKV